MSSFERISAAVAHCLTVPEVKSALTRMEMKPTRSGHFRAYLTLNGSTPNGVLEPLEADLASGAVQLNPFRKARKTVLLTLVDDDEAAVSMDAAANNS